MSSIASLPPGAGARLELNAGLAVSRAVRAPEMLTPEQAEDLLLLDGFVRRPPPELTVVPLDAREREQLLARIREPYGAAKPAVTASAR